MTRLFFNRTDYALLATEALQRRFKAALGRRTRAKDAETIKAEDYTMQEIMAALFERGEPLMGPDE